MADLNAALSADGSEKGDGRPRCFGIRYRTQHRRAAPGRHRSARRSTSGYRVDQDPRRSPRWWSQAVAPEGPRSSPSRFHPDSPSGRAVASPTVPKPRSYVQRTPKKMKRLALLSALSARASESAVKVVDTIDWSAPKTKQAVTSARRRWVPLDKTLVVAECERCSRRAVVPQHRGRAPDPSGSGHSLRRTVGRHAGLHDRHGGSRRRESLLHRLQRRFRT